MPKKRKSTRPQAQPARTPKPIFASPFKDLKKMLKRRAETSPGATVGGSKAAPPPPRATPDVPEPGPPDEQALLREALEGVRPLAGAGRHRVPLEPSASRAVVSEDAEVLAELSDLVSGQGAFDITETEEYVEGARVAIDPRLVTRLRRGEFAVQAHIDLHGKIQVAAREALSAFIVDSTRKGLRTVLVVHGRGLRSPGGHPVLKHAVAQWLSQSFLSGYVLAFATARPADGGAGAMYVLLRRERRRGAFEVLRGAKRRD